jgi:predicted transcriptional regulator
MGKTMLLLKLAYKSIGTNNKVIYFSLQGIKDTAELTDLLLKELRKEQSFGKLRITFNAICKLWNIFKPEEVNIEVVSFKLPEWKLKWKEALVACLEDIVSRKQDENEILTLILDEFPVMLWDWIQNGKADEVIELLDILRQQRQTLENIGKVRFIVCGSVGLQVVLSHLKNKYSYMGEPFNETEVYSIEGMTFDDAYFLCECLYLSGFKTDSNTRKNDYFKSIVNFTEGLPFYINKIFTILSLNYDGLLTDKTIEQATNDLLTQPEYFKTFRHLEDRLKIYYQKPEANVMLSILKYLAKQNETVSEDNIVSSINFEADTVQNVLLTLVSDQYLRRSITDGVRSYQFKYKIIQQWWKLNKA